MRRRPAGSVDRSLAHRPRRLTVLLGKVGPASRPRNLATPAIQAGRLRPRRDRNPRRHLARLVGQQAAGHHSGRPFPVPKRIGDHPKRRSPPAAIIADACSTLKRDALESLSSSPDLAKRLSLSESQQAEIRRVAQPALESAADESLPLETREQRVDEAYAEAMTTLSWDQQRTLHNARPDVDQLPRNDLPAGSEQADQAKAPAAAPDSRLSTAKLRVLDALLSSRELAARLKLTARQRRDIQAAVQSRLRTPTQTDRSPLTDPQAVAETFDQVMAKLTPQQRKLLATGGK